MRHTNILRTVAVGYVQETLLFSKTTLLCFDLKIIPLFTATYPNTETKNHHYTYFDTYSKCTSQKTM